MNATITRLSLKKELIEARDLAIRLGERSAVKFANDEIECLGFDRPVDVSVGDAKTALYRHFAKDGTLLYVGISLNVLGRLISHRGASSWYYRIARVEIEWFFDRQAAEHAEYEAIRAERPVYNKDFNGIIPRKVLR